MKLKTTLFLGSALLLGASLVQAASVDKAGADNRVEWQIQSNWLVDTQPVDMVHSLDGKKVFILNNEHRVLVYNNKGELQGRIPVGEGVNRIDIAPQGEALYLIDEEANSFTSVALRYVVDIDTAGSPFKGKSDAPVTIAVFTDFEWPYCGKLEPLLEQVLEKNSDNVKIVFKNFPLSFHKMADPAHRAAMAANQQGKFWEMHDKLFAAKKLSNKFINSTAEEIGLDMAKFKKDMNSQKIRQQIRKDQVDAKNAGVTGTPSIFINGRQLSKRTPQGFQQMIDQELNKAGK